MSLTSLRAILRFTSLAWSIALCWYALWRTDRDYKLAMDKLTADFSARLAELGRERRLRAAQARPGE